MGITGSIENLITIRAVGGSEPRLALEREVGESDKSYVDRCLKDFFQDNQKSKFFVETGKPLLDTLCWGVYHCVRNHCFCYLGS